MQQGTTVCMCVHACTCACVSGCVCMRVCAYMCVVHYVISDQSASTTVHYLPFY